MRNSLNLPHQTCSAILSTMMDYGLVKGVGERQKNGLHYSQLMFVENEQERDILAFRREQEKFIQWVHRGIRLSKTPDTLLITRIVQSLEKQG